MKKTLQLLSSAVIALGISSAAVAEEKRLVIQVSTNDARTQTIALNNAVNLQKIYGLDDVTIEVVAYGPGIGIMTAKSDNAARVKSLAAQNITFSACNNTLNKIEKKKGKRPSLTEGVEIVDSGVNQIMKLQLEGYAYIRP